MRTRPGRAVCGMQHAEPLLDRVRARGTRGLPLARAYRLRYHPDLSRRA